MGFTYSNAEKHARFLESVNRKNLAIRAESVTRPHKYPTDLKSEPRFNFYEFNKRNLAKRAKADRATTDFVLRLLGKNPRAFL